MASLLLLDDISRIIWPNWILIACFCGAAWWVLTNYGKRRRKGALPGPWGFPVIGVAPFIGRRQEVTYAKWAKKYGDVVGFRVGKNYTVVLNSYDAIQAAFVKNQAFFNDRPNNFIFKDALHKQGFVPSDYTPDYISRRKFSHDVLGRLGFGKTRMETTILDEINNLIRQFGDGEVPLNKKTKEMILYATGNIVFQVTIGKRYDDYEDPEFKDILYGMRKFFENGSSVFVAAVVFPYFTYIPVIRGKAMALKQGLDKLCEVVAEKIEEHEESLDPSDVRDFIDECLLEMKRTGNKSLYSKEVLSYLVRDFFGGGLETTQLTMIFSCLLLANRPAIKQKVHDEIDEILGSEGKPRFALREKMPFCHAVIKEIMRFRSVAPLLIPHSTSESVKFRGCGIPKGATVLGNVYAVHNDPRNWDKPEEFNPERHIDENGKVYSSKYLMVFGAGPRSCPGRQLAEMKVFIFFVRIFQHYDVIPIPTLGCKRPRVDDDIKFTGLTAIPPTRTSVTLVPRKIF